MAEKDVKITLSATDKTRGAFASAEQGLKRLSTTASTISSSLGGLLPAIGVAGLAAFAKQGIDAADSLNDLSDRVGVSVKDLASFKLAAQLADTSLENVGKGISRLTLSIGQAGQGLTTQAKALETLGVTARDPKEAFFQLADAVAKSSDPIKTNAALNDVLGKSYIELLPLLSQGSEALRKSARESETFAEAMARLAPNAGKFNDELDKMKQQSAAAGAAILERLVPGLTTTATRVRELLDDDKGVQALVRAFAGLGKLPFDLIFGDIKIATTAKEKIKELEEQLVSLENQKKRARYVIGKPEEVQREIDIIKNQIIAFKKFGDKVFEKPPQTPAADNLVNYGADVQAALKKAFATNPLDDFLATFKDRRKKIVDEYKALRADLEGGPAGEATTLDVSLQLTKGRAALAQGDASGAQAAAAKAKELFAEVAKKEGTASFEKSYFSRELETFELSIVDSAESAAVTAQKVFAEKLSTLNQDASNLTINVDAAGLTAQVKSVVDQLKKDLAADPLRIPVVAVPSISSDGRQSVDLSTAALQYGNRR